MDYQKIKNREFIRKYEEKFKKKTINKFQFLCFVIYY